MKSSKLHEIGIGLCAGLLICTGVFAADIDFDGQLPVQIRSSSSTKVVTTTTDDLQERLDVESRSTLNPRPGTFIDAVVLDSGSSNSLNVDGSVTPVVFNAVPNSGKIFFVHKVTLIMEDQNINYTGFGGIAGGLTNGLAVQVKEGGEALRNVTAFGPITTNAQFALAGGGLQLTAASRDLFIVIFDVASSGTTFKLVDSDSDFLRITVNDDLTSIDEFKVVTQGYEVDE